MLPVCFRVCSPLSILGYTSCCLYICGVYSMLSVYFWVCFMLSVYFGVILHAVCVFWVYASCCLCILGLYSMLSVYFGVILHAVCVFWGYTSCCLCILGYALCCLLTWCKTPIYLLTMLCILGYTPCCVFWGMLHAACVFWVLSVFFWVCFMLPFLIKLIWKHHLRASSKRVPLSCQW